MQQFTMSISSLELLLAIKTLPMLQEVLHPPISRCVLDHKLCELGCCLPQPAESHLQRAIQFMVESSLLLSIKGENSEGLTRELISPANR